MTTNPRPDLALWREAIAGVRVAHDAVACSWLLGTPARLVGRLVAWRLVWGAMGDLLRARGGRR